MVASQRLEEAVAYAEQHHLLCQQHRKQHNGQADKAADISDENSSATKYSITDNSETATMLSQTQKDMGQPWMNTEPILLESWLCIGQKAPKNSMKGKMRSIANLP